MSELPWNSTIMVGDVAVKVEPVAGALTKFASGDWMLLYKDATDIADEIADECDPILPAVPPGLAWQEVAIKCLDVAESTAEYGLFGNGAGCFYIEVDRNYDDGPDVLGSEVILHIETNQAWRGDVQELIQRWLAFLEWIAANEASND